jgi:hypothetical protein
MTDGNTERMAFYEQLCDNYRAIDDFRTKLLGFLPFATAAGVLVLLNGAIGMDPRDTHTAKQFLAAIGAFGFLVTFGLFTYELHGIKKCGWLIRTGTQIEKSLKIEGAFATRPGRVAGFIDEPFAASVIYPASLAAWAFLALAITSAVAAAATAIGVFIAFFRVSLRLIRWMEYDLEKGRQYGSEPEFFSGRRERRTKSTEDVE